jgi:hypothetical protein
MQLGPRLALWRRVAAAIPQRHQSETRPLRYAFHFVRDTCWPPSRIWRVLRAWRDERPRAAAFASVYRPQAKFMAIGHTHRPGVWRTPAGTVIINTGSFCLSLGGCVVDIAGDRVSVCRFVETGGEFRLSPKRREFSLATAEASPRIRP